MWSVVDAMRASLGLAVSGPSETVALEVALGRVLAADVVAAHDVPPWDNSAMDGYAVVAADLAGSARLRILETVAAGCLPERRVETGTCSLVMTGAPMPQGADAVVPVEDSDRATSGEVQLRGTATPGRYVRRRAGDLRAGDVILPRGATLTAAGLGLCASQGMTSVAVARRPVVAILNTGDEVVRPGAPRTGAQIYSSNHITLRALVEQAGGVAVDLGQVGDDVPELERAAKAGLAHDVLITTGGVSAGLFDHMRGVLERLGVRVEVYKIRIKPGMPVVIGVHSSGEHQTAVFGLPGNPVSCMVSFELFVRPMLRAILGDPRPWPGTLPAVMGHDLRSAPGRARFERVTLRREGRILVAATTGDQSSGVLRSMAASDGLVLLGPEQDGFSAGDLVDVLPLNLSFLQGAGPGFSV